jgi:hypothetical protein
MNDQALLVRFGGGGGTELAPLAVLLVLSAILLILLLPRKYIIVPLFFCTFFIPLSQQLVIFGLHFMMFRIVIIFAWLRLIVTDYSSFSTFRLNVIDRVVIVWAVSNAVTFILLWGEWGAVVQRVGFLYNTFGLYFLFRLLCHTEEAMDLTVKVFATVCSVLAVCMLYEQFAGRNLFFVFGGVPQFSYLCEGRLRAQGAFAHPLLGGTFGATLFPLFIGLWWQGKSRLTAALGVVSATIVTICSMSSTPIMAYAVGVVGFCLWPFRNGMRLIRWAVVLVLVGLHLVMKAPVWALIARIDFTGASSGYHRYQLVDQTITRFSEWWLWGTRSNGSWGWDLWDTSNMFVETALQGGLVTFVLFLAVIVYCFKQLGKARTLPDSDLDSQKWFWALGVALFSNVVAFLGVSYYDQTIVAWYVLLALISTATGAACAKPSAGPIVQHAPGIADSTIFGRQIVESNTTWNFQ